MIDESSAVTQVPALGTDSGANAVALSLKAPHSADALVHFTAREGESRPSDCDFVRVGIVVGADRQLGDTESVEKSLLLEQIVPVVRFSRSQPSLRYYRFACIQSLQRSTAQYTHSSALKSSVKT